MTDDDEARQLADARARREALDRLPGRLDDLESELGEIKEKLAAHDESLEHVAELITEADVRNPFHWPDVLDDETQAQLWGGLLEWIERVLVPWHPAAAKFLPPCWWRHRPAVGLLTDAWVAWIGDYRNKEAKPHDGIAWRAEALALLLDEEAGLRYHLSACKGPSGHQEPVTTPAEVAASVMSTVPRGGEMPGILAD